MSLKQLENILAQKLNDLKDKGGLKGEEKCIVSITEAKDGYGYRYLLAGYGERKFLRMNSNSYLGLSLNKEVIETEEKAVKKFGTGPGAVRFISGTYEPQIKLERKLADFHGRESAMLFSSAYTAVMGVLPHIIAEDTMVLSDELNHNCIINAVRLSKPAKKEIYKHLDMNGLENILKENAGRVKRAVVVTDGVFSMRGDFALLDRIVQLCRMFESGYEEGIITVVDDSHGIGAFGRTGRGTEEYTGASADILIATLGKSLGVNGGYAVSTVPIIKYLRESSPFYIYSNPITPAEASAAIKSLDILGSLEGLNLLERIKELAVYLRNGLKDLGYETISGEHPIVPLMIRDTLKTSEIVRYLFDNNILATAINFPIVPKGEEEIRLQVSAVNTIKDIDYLLDVLKRFKGRN